MRKSESAKAKANISQVYPIHIENNYIYSNIISASEGEDWERRGGGGRGIWVLIKRAVINYSGEGSEANMIGHGTMTLGL